jgi:N-acetylmuramoyl-L-alanine amidase
MRIKTGSSRIAWVLAVTALVSLLHMGKAAAETGPNHGSTGIQSGALSGKLIIIDPGHGRTHVVDEKGRHSYNFDRPIFQSALEKNDAVSACADVDRMGSALREDCLNLYMAEELRGILYSMDESATVQLTRSSDRYADFINGNYPAERHPWFEMNTFEWLYSRKAKETDLKGCLPEEKDLVIANAVLDDIKARSCYANTLIQRAGNPGNATISLHADSRAPLYGGTLIIYTAAFNRTYSGKSKMLAETVHDCMEKFLDPDGTSSWNILDVRQSDESYGEIDYVAGPAVLIEMGNSANADDFDKLVQRAVRQQALEAVAAAVVEYFGGPVCSVPPRA